MSGTRVSFVDLAAQHAEIGATFEEALQEIIASSAYINGPAVAEFEERYADFAGVRHCIGVANGTDAIELALRAACVGHGEVILPANSFIATAEAVVRAGASPVFADVDPRTHLLDVEAVLDRVGPKTRAVIPVHLYGQMAEIPGLMSALADRPDIIVIEDAAQAHGADQHGSTPGSRTVAASTSFYPGKNLGAYGDAGAVLTNDAEVARRVHMLRDHGMHEKHRHELIGFNSRLDTVQAAVLIAKLSRLRDWNDARRVAASRYDELLGEFDDVVRPVTAAGNTHVWHLYVLQIPHRDTVLTKLRAAGIEAGIHYPVPIHLQPAFAALEMGPGSFPVCEAAAERILSLPMHPHLTASQQERVVSELALALGSP